MALRRRASDRSGLNIWPGFVDAMGSLLLVLLFVLSVFMIVQAVLRDTVTNQDRELDSLAGQVAELATTLGLEQDRNRELSGDLQMQNALVATLNTQIANQARDLQASAARITSFEAQVLALLGERDSARASLAETEAARDQLLTEQEAMSLALAQARSEIDASTEAARLDAAKREAMEALIRDLQTREGAIQDQLSQAEAQRLVDAAAAEALRARLATADAELTAMTLALEAQRKEAQDTLTELAAAKLARQTLDQTQQKALSEAERKAALLALAEQTLAEQKTFSNDQARQIELLNQQVASLRGQLGSLQGLLEAAETADADSRIQLDALGTQLNSALAQVAAEQRRRAALEEAERLRLEAEKQNLEKFRSEFFGQLREVLSGREGVRVVGDRFVFSSEVLFAPGSADLQPEGQAQIARVASILSDVGRQIPESIDWILRVDGHTDNVPLSGAGAFTDNWQLSQARALSVVRYLQSSLGFPPSRLAATGFGEYRPVVDGNSPEARAQNRRIELKLTER